MLVIAMEFSYSKADSGCSNHSTSVWGRRHPTRVGYAVKGEGKPQEIRWEATLKVLIYFDLRQPAGA
jgi:hypothetical protein